MIQSNNNPLKVNYRLGFGEDSVLTIQYKNRKGETEFDLFYFNDHTKILDSYYEVKKQIKVA